MYKSGAVYTPINQLQFIALTVQVKTLNQSEGVPLAPLDARSTGDSKGVSVAVGAGEDYSMTMISDNCLTFTIVKTERKRLAYVCWPGIQPC
jgi:hypothetical protein